MHPTLISFVGASGRRRAVSVAAWLCVCGAASAQSTLPETVVRAPLERSAWGAQTIDANMTPVPLRDDVSAWLREVAGASTLAGGGVSALPVLRGLADERIRLQIDGMDLYAACPNHMNTPLSYLGPTQVESVQVWAGAAPVSAGGDTLGGVLNVRT
ncbi:MAG: TonB-dependent receptor plug domain-containing protein, partial [Tepidimonas sp.]|uniref:TonB-dependent receptor plug domain-containing protein n=1 Tax=Tepidimonas sp. TaxID=2002775 RepID=UPI004055295E